MIILIYFLVVFILIISFFNIKSGVLLYLGFLILVPYLRFRFFGLEINHFNLLPLFLLIAFIFNYPHEKLYTKVLAPFLFLLFSLTIISFFASPQTILHTIFKITIKFVGICIFPLIIWNLLILDFNFLNKIKMALSITTFISCFYGIILIALHGKNPYTTTLASYFGAADSAAIYSNIGTRLSFSSAGKIQSTMDHPMIWALFLSLSFILYLLFYIKSKNNLYLLFLVLISFNILTSGVRSSIAALFIGFIYFFLKDISYKKIVLFCSVILVVFVIAIVIPDIRNILLSFLNLSNSDNEIGGSSVIMRVAQFFGAIDEIQGKEFFGKGYDWHIMYLEKYQNHPVLLAFESLIFIALCDSGVIGLLSWIAFSFLLLYTAIKYIKINSAAIYANLLIITYFAFVIITGDYGYLRLFAIYYIIILFQCSNKDRLVKSII